jgi:hypothetical protein
VTGSLKRNHGSFLILHDKPAGPIEAKWRACLAASDFPTHYTAPAYFLEPAVRDKRPFAILSLIDGNVTAVLTGINDRNRVRSGLPVRPQIAFSRSADRALGTANLISGVFEEAKYAKLVDLFLWSDMESLFGSRFHRKRCEGVAMLDLQLGPDALLRKFSENKRTNIKKAIKYGVTVDIAKGKDDISGFFPIYVDWSRRKALPVMREEQFHQTFELTLNRRLFLARSQGQIIAGVVVRFFPGGVMEYAANSSLQSALRLRPNDLLHWRAIEWACAEGLTKYSLGGTHLFLRKFGGEVVPTTRCRRDLSLFRRFAIADWITDRAEQTRPFVPGGLVNLGRSLRSGIGRLRPPPGPRAA